MRRSLIREKLARDEFITIAQSWIIPHWKLVDLMGHVGFDSVWLEHEHSDFTIGELGQMILAARAHDMDSLVRVERSGYTSTLKILEAGATGIIVPHCMGGDDAKTIVRDAKYAPLGMRGAGGSVDADYGTKDRTAYFEHANRDTLVIVIIEDKEAVEDIDSIAATEGVDGILLGPGDLSQSYGVIGQMDHPLIHEAVTAIADACARHGKAWGAPVGSREHAQQLLNQGARLMQLGNDQTALVEGFTASRDSVKNLTPAP